MKTPGIDRPVSPRHRRPTLGALVIVLALAGAVASVPVASAQAAATKTKDKKVVQVVTRTPEGTTTAVTMLATVKGRSLYTAPASGCTGGCLSIWPPLYVAKGKTPTGVTGLGTVTVMVGKKTKFQVTYMGKALYTFVDDSKTSADGNGVGGFMLATVS